MTIRRRLFLSNILMLIIPAVLSIVISYFILFIFTGHSVVPMERAFPRAFDIIATYRRGRDEEALFANVEQFNSDFRGTKVFMAVIEGGEVIYPPVEEVADVDSIHRLVLAEEVTGSITINNIRFFVERAGERRIVLVETQFPVGRGFNGHLVVQVLIVIGVMILIILMTNRLLTYLITKRIMASLNCLSDGVNQLQEGNLDYRIPYRNNDEFAPVCRNFNIMAENLQRLIERQQKDEHSRKELLAGISHDLRTPLTSIKAYVEGLLDGVAEDLSAQLRYLSIIRSKAEDIDQLVDKLFLFSKLDIEEYPFYHEKLDIGAELRILTDAAEEEYSNRGLEVTIATSLEQVYVYADPVQLHNALVNVLENSLRYKNKEKCIVTVRCFDGQRYVTLCLTDDGPGVPEADLEKLFDVFYRGDPSRQSPSKGSGLGLAITRKIMGRMGGAIWAENATEGGLRMVMELPKFAEDE